MGRSRTLGNLKWDFAGGVGGSQDWGVLVYVCDSFGMSLLLMSGRDVGWWSGVEGGVARCGVQGLGTLAVVHIGDVDDGGLVGLVCGMGMWAGFRWPGEEFRIVVFRGLGWGCGSTFCRLVSVMYSMRGDGVDVGIWVGLGFFMLRAPKNAHSFADLFHSDQITTRPPTTPPRGLELYLL
ncbi:hypothetical protein Tco_1490890 [Tanacetum coccineum]